MPHIAILAIVSALLLATLALATDSHHTSATVPGYNGKIAFVSGPGISEGPLNLEIMVMEPDGSNIVNLTNSPESELDPAWSPDGTQIAFSRSGELWLMDADGSNQVQLTSGGADYDPAWAPDGTKIAFLAIRDQGDATYLLDLQSDEISLLISEGGTNVAPGPAFSPDGAKIAYGVADLFVANADGSNPVQLTHNPTGTDLGPTWSPDGTRIAFRGYRDNVGDIYAINPDGTGEVNLTHSEIEEDESSWSPDGTRIVYSASVDIGRQEIFVMAADGSGQTQLTTSVQYSYSPDWQPLAEDPGTTPFPLATTAPSPTTTTTASPESPGGLPIGGGPKATNGGPTLPPALAAGASAILIATASLWLAVRRRAGRP